MKNERKISLLVTPYVHSFLQNEFGTLTFFARQNTVIGHHLISSLILDYQGKTEKTKNSKYVRIVLNKRMAAYYGKLHKVAKRNYFFDILFKEKFLSFVDGMCQNEVAKYHAVRAFCEKYKITPEMIDEATLYRIYQKHKKNRKIIENN